jgi:hypothetical protein
MVTRVFVLAQIFKSQCPGKATTSSHDIEYFSRNCASLHAFSMIAHRSRTNSSVFFFLSSSDTPSSPPASTATGSNLGATICMRSSTLRVRPSPVPCSPMLVGLFCLYIRSLLTMVSHQPMPWQLECGRLRSITTSHRPQIRPCNCLSSPILDGLFCLYVRSLLTM